MKIKDLMSKRDKIAADMRAMHEAAEKDDRGFTDEERGKWSEMNKDLRATDDRIKTSKEANELDSALDEIRNSLGKDADTALGDLSVDSDDESYDTAFRSLLRSIEPGMSGLGQEQRGKLQAGYTAKSGEKRAMGIATGAGGGFSVPEGFGDRVIETLKNYGGIMNVATVLTTASGEDIPFPTVDDTGNIGAIITENTTISDQDVAMGQKTLRAYMYSSLIIKLSMQLLQDSGIDIEGLIARLIGVRIGRAASAHFATGTGTGQPEGVTVGAGAGPTAAAAAALGYTDLTALKYSVDAAYHATARFLANQTTIQLLEEMVDADGRPLWLPGLAERAPATILGHAYTIDNSMPAATTGNRAVVFGDMTQYMVRQVQNIMLMRLVERYAENLQVGFLGFVRMDGKVVDASAIKYLQMA